MIKQIQNSCVECNETITNPLCSNCISKQMKFWVLENNYDKRILKEIDKTLKSKNRHSDGIEPPRCSACGEKNAFICPYCFTEMIYYKLLKLKAKGRVMQEFIQFFNYDFQRDEPLFVTQFDEILNKL